MWSDEDIEQAWEAWRSGTGTNPERTLSEAMRRVMTKAAELLAARGGTMTADELATCLAGVMCAGIDADDDSHGARLRRHISAQGARVAVLENERRLSAEHDAVTLKELGAESTETVLGLARRLHRERAALKKELADERKQHDNQREATHEWAEQAVGLEKKTDGAKTTAMRAGYEDGIEAMREACWAAVRERLHQDGMTTADILFQDLKAAIEGAAP